MTKVTIIGAGLAGSEAAWQVMLAYQLIYMKCALSKDTSASNRKFCRVSLF